MTSAVRRLLFHSALCAVTVPMLAACGSGRSPASVVTSIGATTTAPATSGFTNTTATLSSTGSTEGTAAPAGSTTVSSGKPQPTVVAPTTTASTANVTDAQVVGLEQTLNDIDAILANLDKTIAADATVVP